MAEGRMLKRCISESKKLGRLKSDSERLLYTWLIPWLDVEGRHSADPEIIKGHIFPKVKNITPKKISNLLNLLSDEKLIILYSANGEDYLQFKKFHELQTIRKDREGDSKIPPPSKDSRITPGASQDKPSLNKDKLIEIKNKVIDYFNETTNQKRSYNCDETNKMINGRLDEGRTLNDFKHVIDTKATQWFDDPKMRKYLRPSTLFRPGHFEDYLNESYEDPEKKILKVGESSRIPSKKEDNYAKARAKKMKELQEKYQPEYDKANKAQSIDWLDLIDNKIKEEIAEFSRNYKEGK